MCALNAIFRWHRQNCCSMSFAGMWFHSILCVIGLARAVPALNAAQKRHSSHCWGTGIISKRMISNRVRLFIFPLQNSPMRLDDIFGRRRNAFHSDANNKRTHLNLDYQRNLSRATPNLWIELKFTEFLKCENCFRHFVYHAVHKRSAPTRWGLCEMTKVQSSLDCFRSVRDLRELEYRNCKSCCQAATECKYFDNFMRKPNRVECCKPQIVNATMEPTTSQRAITQSKYKSQNKFCGDSFKWLEYCESSHLLFIAWFSPTTYSRIMPNTPYEACWAKQAKCWADTLSVIEIPSWFIYSFIAIKYKR